jgi:hypothetical protein
MIRKLTISAAVVLSITACASAAKRTEQGQQLQQQGRPAEASDRYIQALKKDQTIQAARDGLRTAGASAIDTWLRAADSPGASPGAAADDYVAVDDLAKRAMEVGIYLVKPNDYDTRRRSMFDKAIDNTIINAKQLALGRQYADAVNSISRAVSAYQPNPTQNAALGFLTGDIALQWARSDTTNGQFRSAYSRVDQIASLPGVMESQTIDARALQAAALARGTKTVAIVPPSATVNARRQLPPNALPALGQALLSDPWVTPPRFVALVPALQVALELRGLGFDRRTLTTTDAARFALVTGADFVVVTEIDTVRHDEVATRSTRHAVRTRNGADTAYYVDEGQSRLYAGATFVIIGRDGQRWSDYQPVNATTTSSFTRGRFAGDIRSLDLPQADRDLFARGPDANDLSGSLVGALSPRLADAIFAQILQRVP